MYISVEMYIQGVPRNMTVGINSLECLLPFDKFFNTKDNNKNSI